MKNKLTLFILLLLAVLPVYSQFKKGDSFGNVGLSGYFRATQRKNQGTSLYEYSRSYFLSTSIAAEKFIHPKISLIYGGGIDWEKEKEKTNSIGGTIYSDNSLGLNMTLGINHYQPILPKLLVMTGFEANLEGSLIWRDLEYSNYPDQPRQNINSLTHTFNLYAGLVSPLNEDVLMFLKVPLYKLAQSNYHYNGNHIFTSNSHLEIRGGLLFRLSTLKSMLKKKNGNAQ